MSEWLCSAYLLAGVKPRQSLARNSAQHLYPDWLLEKRTCAQSPSHPMLTLPINSRELFTATFLALVSSAGPRSYMLLGVVQGGVPGKQRGTPQFSGPWVLMGAQTMWEHKQALRKTPETPAFFYQCRDRRVLTEDKQSQFCKWHIHVRAVFSKEKSLPVLTGIFLTRLRGTAGSHNSTVIPTGHFNAP